MASLNQVILAGRLGKDPDVRGRSENVVSLRVATERRFKPKDSDEWKSETQWHAVVCFAKPSVEFAKKYLKKGDEVLVRGSLETREHEGKYYTEVVIRPFEGELQGFGSRRKAGEDDEAPRTRSSGGEDYSRAGSRDEARTWDNGEDDTIPF